MRDINPFIRLLILQLFTFLILQFCTFKMAATKTDAQKVAYLLMKYCGCHQVNIFVLSSKHKKMMENKSPYNPSHLSMCVPVVNRYSSKGLRSSDGSNKSSVVLESSLRRAIKTDRLSNPLRRIIKPSDVLKRKAVEVDNTSNHVFKPRSIRRELFDERFRHEKPRPSDAFLFRIPKECYSETEKHSDDLSARRLPTYKPRLSDAFMRFPLRVPEYFSDADDESDSDLLRSRRVVNKPLRRTIRLSKNKKPDNLPLPTEDDELMSESSKTEMKPVSLSDFTKSGRFEIKDGQFYKHSLVSKRPYVACRTVKRNPNAKVRKC